MIEKIQNIPSNVAGIYKITSPSGKIYIGQSINVRSRMKFYLYIKCKKQKGIFRSLIKYGVDKHCFDLIHQLPLDVEQDVLDSYEALYLQLHKDAGLQLLNIRDAGSRGRLSEATKAILSVKASGRKHSEETRKKMSERNKVRGTAHLHTPEARKKMSESRKGQPSWNKGKSVGIGAENNFFGRKHSVETIKKLKERAGDKNPMFGKKLSDETKRRIGQKNKIKLKGRIPWNKGKKGIYSLSDEARKKISEKAKGRPCPWLKGKKASEETKSKLSEARKGNKNAINNPTLSKKVYQYSLTGELLNFFPSMAEAERNGFSASCIGCCINGKQKTHKGFIWKYLE